MPNPSVLALPDADEGFSRSTAGSGAAGKTKSNPSKPSLLSTTKHSHSHPHSHPHSHSSTRASSRPLTPTDRGTPLGGHLPSHLHLSASNPSLSLGLGRASPVLSTTPSTPGLVPHSSTEDADPDLSDWEHVDDFDEGAKRADAVAVDTSGPDVPGEDESDVGEVDSEGEEDVIVLGELELEDELDLVDRRKERRLEQMENAKIEMGKKNVARSPVSYAAALGVKGAAINL